MEHEPVLIIGYGNRLRGDDGAGPRAAEALDKLQLAGARVIAAHQLTPELSAHLASARCVIFLDADPTVDRVLCERIDPREYLGVNESALFGHALGPSSLLALTSVLFGGEPASWLVRIPAPVTDLTDKLSPAAQAGVAESVRLVRQLVERRAASDPSATVVADGGVATHGNPFARGSR